MTQVLQRIDDDQIRACTRIEPCLNTEQSWNLRTCNGDRRTSHEPTHCRRGNELNDPPKAEEADTKDDETAYESNSGGDLGSAPDVWML